MERTISATEAHVHFDELLRRVAEQRETVVVERGGEPQVVVLSVAEYERLQGAEKGRKDWKALVQRSRERMRITLNGRPLPAPEEVIRQMREERDEQLLRLR